MKKVIRQMFLFLVILAVVSVCFVACDDDITPCDTHVDANGDHICDVCEEAIVDEPGGDDRPIIYSLVLSASKTIASRGDVITLEAVLKAGDEEETITEDLEYILVEGAGSAVLTGNTLKISNTATHGTVIKVKVREGATDSNVVEITVNVPATAVVISANGTTNVLAGNSVVITNTITPTGADSDIKFEITEGADIATMSGNVLVVGANAPTGKTIKVKASVGTVASNEIAFTVGYPLETITVTTTASNIKSGEMAQLGVSIAPANATNADYVWTFVEGGDYAVIVNNVLTVKSNAPTGAIIKVKAVAGEVESNVVEFTVGYPLETITVTAGVTNIMSGGMAQLGVAIAPTNATNADYVWTFEEGGDYAVIVNNVLTVASNAPTGAKIKVKAVAGSISSNSVEFTVGYPLETITVTTTATNILSGAKEQLIVAINPTNATNANYAWVFEEGQDLATIIDNVLTVKADAPTGAKIKVKAVAGSISSNSVEFIVGYPLESLTASLVGSSSNIKPGSFAHISVNPTPANSTNADYVWSFVAGEEFASIVNNIITINSDAPIGSIIKIVAVAGDIRSNEIIIMVGTPVESITISSDAPEVLEREVAYTFAIDEVTPEGASKDAIEWVVSGINSSLVTISPNGTITFKNGTPAGSEVKIYASSGSIKSNVLTYTVGVAVESISATLNGSANIEPGTSRALSYVINPSNASDTVATWVISKGSEYATISGGMIFVNSDAPIGATVTFNAEIGDVKSNDITITVGVVLEKIEISLVGSANVDPDASRIINSVFTPENASLKNITWVISEGSEYATINGGVLSVNEDAPIGAKVTFYGQIGDVKSEPITITVGTPIETITIEATGSLEVVKGNSVGLLASVTPAKASASRVSWEIVQGTEYASIIGATLVVKADATTGEKIVVRATAENGTVVSNELEITVMATQEEINAGKFFIDPSTNEIRLDKFGATTPKLTAKILNGNYDEVKDLELEFSIIEGQEYLQINPDGYVCTFAALGHGNAVVEIKIVGTEITEKVNVEVIVPPTSITLPEVFTERRGYEYNFSKVNPLTNAVEALPFMPTINGVGACQDLKFTFMHESGKTGDDVAIHDGQSIIFKQTGKVTVTISSASGSRLEAMTTYTFNINEGYNVHSYEELDYIVRHGKYNGVDFPINFVVLEKPVAQYETTYTYGYDLVPAIALWDPSLQTVELMKGKYASFNGFEVGVRIQAVNKGLWINGNNHKIDASQLRVYTQEEYDKYALANGVTGGFANNSSLLSAEPWSANGPTDPAMKDKAYNVRLYDVEIKGNTPFNYNPALYSNTGSVVGAFGEGINIGQEKYDMVHYYIDVNNITASGFKIGLKLTNVVGNGKVRNIHVYDCYSTGIVTRTSIITLENLKIGICGATGIELGPEDSDKAGLGKNEKSKVTITGTVDASTNLNDGATNYFKYYNVAGETVPKIINDNAIMYDINQVAHIRNSQGQFIFVSLLFNDMSTLAPNQSVVEYPAYQAGGIINIAQLPTSGIDTEHQFIEMTIYFDHPVMGQVPAGTAYFYNHHYAG